MTGPGAGDAGDGPSGVAGSSGSTARDRAVDLTPTPAPPDGAARDDTAATTHGGRDDPLRLCVFATVALIAWLAGPWAVLGFAGLGFVGYWRARRHGLLRSRCLLGDTRVVLVYLGLLVAVAAWGAWRSVA